MSQTYLEKRYILSYPGNDAVIERIDSGDPIAGDPNAVPPIPAVASPEGVETLSVNVNLPWRPDEVHIEQMTYYGDPFFGAPGIKWGGLIEAYFDLTNEVLFSVPLVGFNIINPSGYTYRARLQDFRNGTYNVKLRFVDTKAPVYYIDPADNNDANDGTPFAISFVLVFSKGSAPFQTS